MTSAAGKSDIKKKLSYDGPKEENKKPKNYKNSYEERDLKRSQRKFATGNKK